MEANEKGPVALFFEEVIGLTTAQQQELPSISSLIPSSFPSASSLPSFHPTTPPQKPLSIRHTELLQFLCSNLTKNNDSRGGVLTFCTSGGRCNRSVWGLMGDFFGENSEILRKLPTNSLDFSAFSPLFDQEDGHLFSAFGPPRFGEEIPLKVDEYRQSLFDFEEIKMNDLVETFVDFLLKGVDCCVG